MSTKIVSSALKIEEAIRNLRATITGPVEISAGNLTIGLFPVGEDLVNIGKVGYGFSCIQYIEAGLQVSAYDHHGKMVEALYVDNSVLDPAPPEPKHRFGSDWSRRISKEKARDLLNVELPKMGYEVQVADAVMTTQGVNFRTTLMLENSSGTYWLKSANSRVETWSRVFGVTL